MKKKCCLAIIVFLSNCYFLLGQNIYNFDSSKKFANYLIKSGQYQFAISEYERLHFLNKEDEFVKQLLIKSYLLNGDYLKASVRCFQFDSAIHSWSPEISSYYLQSLILSEQFTLLREDLVKINLSDTIKSKYLLHAALLNGEWKLAEDFQNINTQYLPLINRGVSVKKKSPFLAGVLSTLFPGAGKFYTGNIKDGLFSILIVGGSCFQAYRGFSKDGVQSGTGWFFSGLAGGFYAGNIYGSVKSAQVYNYANEKEIKDEARSIILDQYY